MKISRMLPVVIVFFFVALLSGHVGYSQISIGSDDMPLAGDTLRVSITNQVPSGYAATGMDTAWNFSMLEAISQRVETFVSASSTPAAYQLFFVYMGGANLASPQNNSILPGLPLTNGFTFYKNSTASYGELGSAYTVQGVPIPAKYDNPDKYYEFPMTLGKTWNSTSIFELQVPNIAYLSIRLSRSSTVDGWGRLTTPFGVFQTVRVKSTVFQHDSIYIDSLGLGFPLNRTITEYKWLGTGQGIPLLQINKEGNNVFATYRDIYRMSAQPLAVTLGPDTAVYKGTTLTMHATVTGGTPPYQVLWNTLDTGSSITVIAQDTKTYTVLVLDALQNFSSAQKTISIRYPPGIGEEEQSFPRISPNPSSGKVTVTVPSADHNLLMEVVSPLGMKVRSGLIIRPNQPNFFDFSDLSKGIYLLRINDPGHHHVEKLIIN